jgi:hypothetical protein
VRKSSGSRLAAAALLAVLAFTPPATAERIDACTLLTRADAETLLGGSLAPPVTNAGEPAGNVVSQCAYASPGHGHLTLLVRPAPTAAAAAAAYEHARAAAQALTGSAPLEVAGVGERAYWTGGTFRQLTVLAKKVCLIVSADLGDGRDRLEGAKAAARKAVSRM